jgi:hypothetical protein
MDRRIIRRCSLTWGFLQCSNYTDACTDGTVSWSDSVNFLPFLRLLLVSLLFLLWLHPWDLDMSTNTCYMIWLVSLLVSAWITKINSNKWQMGPCSLHPPAAAGRRWEGEVAGSGARVSTARDTRRRGDAGLTRALSPKVVQIVWETFSPDLLMKLTLAQLYVS